MNKRLLRNLILEALSDEERNTLYNNAGDEKELKKAYRKLLQKHHPDISSDDKEEATVTTQEINQIYADLLSGSGEKRTSNTRSQPASQTSQSQDNERLKREIVKKMMSATTISDFKDAYIQFVDMKYRKVSINRYLDAVDMINRIETGTFQDATFFVGKLDNLSLKVNGMSPAHVLAYIIYINQAYKDLSKRDSINGFVKNYEIAAGLAPMNIRPENRKIVEESVLAVKKIGEMMSFLKRAKYMFLGPSTEEVNLMTSLINKTSDLKSGLDFKGQLKRIILD